MQTHASPQNPFFELTARCSRILSSMSPLAVVRASIFVLCSDNSSIAPAGQRRGQSLDISIAPKLITEAFDRAGIRDAEENGLGKQTSRKRQDSCSPPPRTVVCSPVVAATALAVPSNAQKKSFGSLLPILGGARLRDLRQLYICFL